MYLLHVFFVLFLTGYCYGETCHTAHDCHQTSCTHSGDLVCDHHNCICNIQNGCSTNPCENHSTCHPTSHAPYYSCQCRVGYTGVHCEHTYCDSNPCQNGAHCSKLLHAPFYHCNCPHEYQGTNCEQHNMCSTNPCVHGKCHPNTHQPYYSCQCNSGIIGLTCNDTHCSSDPCQHGGHCSANAHPPYYHCSCPHNFVGTNCERDMCSNNPCYNQGTCQLSTHQPYYTCQCQDGWTGQHCQENMCYSKPCENKGTCHQTSHAPYYECSCHFSWTGLNCTHTMCDTNPCARGSTCVTLHDQPYYRCECPHNHFGTHCEHRICSSHSCYNGGTCVPNSQTNKYTCTCSSGYSGDRCRDSNLQVTSTPTTSVTTTKSTTKPPPRVHITDVPYDPNYGPYCLTCDDVVSPNTCEYVARCGQHEICSVDSFVTSSGVVRYNLGCKDAQQCPSTKRAVNSGESEDASTITVCSECCKEHLCNSGGCGVTGYTQLTVADRGPICFHCDQENSPGECSTIAVCGRDEVCAVTHTKVATTQQTLWKSWCMHTSECIHELQQNMNNTAIDVFNVNNKYGGLRSGGHCWFMCCLHDLCNRRCADTSAPLYTSLIG